MSKRKPEDEEESERGEYIAAANDAPKRSRIQEPYHPDCLSEEDTEGDTGVKVKVKEEDPDSGDDEDEGKEEKALSLAGPADGEQGEEDPEEGEEEDAEAVEAAAVVEAKSRSGDNSDDDGGGGGGDDPVVVFSVGSMFNHRDAVDSAVVYKKEDTQRFKKSGELGTSVNQEQLSRYWGACDQDITVKVASDFILDLLLAGGVVFRQNPASGGGGGDGAEKRKKHTVSGMPDRKQKRWSAAWTEFTRQMMKCIWECGFVAVMSVPHPEDGAMPRILDLTAVDVFVDCNMVGERRFTYRRRPNNTATGARFGTGFYSGDPIGPMINRMHAQHNKRDRKVQRRRGTDLPGASLPDAGVPLDPYPSSSGGGRGAAADDDTDDIIGGILTFTDGKLGPQRDGTVWSRMATIERQSAVVEFRRAVQLQAEYARANPAYFTQENKTDSRRNRDKPSSMGTVTNQFLLDSVERAIAPGGRDSRGKGGAVLDQMAHEISRHYGPAAFASFAKSIGGGGGGGSGGPDSAAVGSMLFEGGTGVGDRIDVPDGREIRPAAMPEAPKDLTKDAIWHAANVFAVFGIPDGIIQSSTIGARSGGAAKPQGTTSGEKLLQLRLIDEKRQVIRILADVYRLVLPRQADALGRAVPLDEPLDVDSLENLEVVLPGIPSEEKLLNYWTLGLLKTRKLRETISEAEGIPLDDLEEDPEPKQTEFIPEPVAPATAGKSSRPKAKAKGKGKPKAKAKKKKKSGK